MLVLESVFSAMFILSLYSSMYQCIHELMGYVIRIISIIPSKTRTF